MEKFHFLFAYAILKIKTFKKNLKMMCSETPYTGIIHLGEPVPLKTL
jgi:hypothetical protein